MPDTLTPERRYQIEMGHDPRHNDCEVCALLRHIDAITAAVRRVESEYDAVSGWHDTAYEGVTDALYAVLAILRGEQQPKQTWAQRGRRLAAEEPHDA